MTKRQNHRGIAAIHGAIFVSAVIGTAAAQAQTYTVLHRFTGEDGQYPQASLLRDSAGDLYGTTFYGGVSGMGVVFKLDKTGETVPHSFAGTTVADGANPYGSLIRDPAGNLYGTTEYGGINNGGLGWGTVFRVDPAGTETVLHGFTGGDDGGLPIGSLLRDSAGNLYGTALAGGAGGRGVVFKMDPTGVETVLHNFRWPDGSNPEAGLILDSAGSFYGTTQSGGASNHGVVFRLSKTGETVLHDFTGADGSNPIDSLVRDSTGNLFGTTFSGGASGKGVVFKLDTSGTETVLHSFTGGADGANPGAGVILDSTGNLYGTTFYGGASGFGVVFKLDPSGTETVLHSFTQGADGAHPEGGLIRDAAGNLYGTAQLGGVRGLYGLVFRLTP